MTNLDAHVLRENTGTSGVLASARDLAVDPAVTTLYLETWDALRAEQ